MRKHDGPFIRVKDLTVGYGDGNVIENASFDVQ